MREIRFRAWDKQEKKYYNVNAIDFKNEYYLELEDVETLRVITMPRGRLYKDFILEQFTGLRDKNGKEVYFGDILATSNSDQQYDIWDKEDNGYTVVQECPNELGVEYSNWAATDDKASIYNWVFVEVIGNIHENPETIKDANT